MKKFAIAASLFLLTTAAHAGSYQVHGVTVSFRDGCRSTSCVSVNAPGYGSYNGRGLADKRLAKAQAAPHKDQSRILPEPKPDATAPAAQTPATEPLAAKPAEPVAPKTPMKTAAAA